MDLPAEGLLRQDIQLELVCPAGLCAKQQQNIACPKVEDLLAQGAQAKASALIKDQSDYLEVGLLVEDLLAQGGALLLEFLQLCVGR